MAALDAGYATTASGVTLDRFCGSGISSVNFAAASVMSGMEDVVIAGGTEMMSSYAGNVSKSRSPFLDSGNAHLRAIHPQTNQGVAADAIATLEGIDRRAVDDRSRPGWRGSGSRPVRGIGPSCHCRPDAVHPPLHPHHNVGCDDPCLRTGKQHDRGMQ